MDAVQAIVSGDEFLSARIGADGADLRFGQLGGETRSSRPVRRVRSDRGLSNTACCADALCPQRPRRISCKPASPSEALHSSRTAAGSPSRTRIVPSSNRCGFGFNSGCLARFRAHRGDGSPRVRNTRRRRFTQLRARNHADLSRAGLQLKTRLSRPSALEHILAAIWSAPIARAA